MVKVVFMGTPDFAVPSLKKLIETQQVVGVVTQPDRPAGRGRQPRSSPVKVVAEAAQIPLYQPKSLRKEAAAATLQAWQPDIIVVAAFGQILRSHVLDLPPHGCLNVHASLLPRWRGASPIHHAVLAGDAETGITLMKMDVGLDTGPIYVKEKTPILPNDTAATLHDRLAELGAKMIGTYLEDIVNGRLMPTPQDDTLSTYAPMIKKEDGLLNWSADSVALFRQVRAMTPWPGAFTTWQGKHLKILSAIAIDNPVLKGEIGQVVTHNDNIVVITGQGALCLDKIQLAGKRATHVADFVHGRPDFIGSQLGL